MIAQAGMVVSYRCTVRNPAGEVVSVTPAGVPVRFVHGVTPIVPGIAAALGGCRAGDRREVDIDDAFGARDQALVRDLDRSLWPSATPPELGSTTRFTEVDADGASRVVVGHVTHVDAHRITVDANPPLVGQRLTFELHVIDVRPATDRERHTGQVTEFPLDVIGHRTFSGPVGDAIVEFRKLSMTPPYPWGQWLVGRQLLQRLEHVPGDLIELGVGLGGMSLFLARLAQDRTVYSLDTFAGLPEPDARLDNPYWVAGLYDGSEPLLERFRAAAATAGLEGRVVPVPGLFRDTVAELPPDLRLCLAHLDSDLYHSVWDSLVGVWDRLEPGGLLVVDDFFHHAQGALRACGDFFNERGIQPVYHVIFPYSVAVVKGEGAASRANRSLDGNTYSFDWLAGDPELRAVIEASAARSLAGTRAHDNASRMLALLTADFPRTSDVYEYWRIMEDWWDAMSAGFTQADRI